MTLAVGGLYEAADLVREALAPSPDYQKTILDLGEYSLHKTDDDKVVCTCAHA